MKTSIITAAMIFATMTGFAGQSKQSLTSMNRELTRLTSQKAGMECDTNEDCCRVFSDSCKNGQSRVYELLIKIFNENERRANAVLETEESQAQSEIGELKALENAQSSGFFAKK